MCSSAVAAPGPVRSSPVGDHARGGEVRHAHRGGVAALGRAVLVQDGDLVAHGVRIAEQVAGVGVARDEPQRLALARSADEDRDALLQRPRVADRLGDRRRAALEARRARAPHERQQLERVLQQRVAVRARREVPAVELVLALKPGRAEAAHRAPAAQHVERGDDLREVREVAVRDAGDERAEADRLGHAREVAERRVALEHVLPLAPDLRDLQQVVHDPEAGEAGLLGRAGDVGERRRGRRRMAGEAEAADLQAELEHRGILALARRRRNGVEERRRHEDTRRPPPAAVHGGEALAGELLEDALDRGQLPADDLARHRRAAGPVALAHELGRRVEHDRDGRHAVPLGERAPAGAPLGLQAGRVDHGRQPARQPLGDDELEQLERVLRRALVALAGADDGAQAVGGDDLLGREPLRRPVRLARPAGADEHDEAGIGETQRHGHAAQLTRTAAAPSR